ncbi:hypothetical protein J2Z26_003655 [Bacillus luteolus]|nr:hypothetical protein [Cytobacillus luteolus]
MKALELDTFGIIHEEMEDIGEDYFNLTLEKTNET